MKKRILYSILALLIAVHFYFLHCFGISAFSTTLLFYFLIYQVLKLFTLLIRNTELRETVRINIRVFLALLLLVELLSTFILHDRNEYTENKTGVYFSPYMHREQMQFLSHFIKGVKLNVWEEGYGAYYRHRHKTRDFDYEVQYNRLGLRGPLPPLHKDSGEYRIVVLGDSFAEGYGSSEDSTFPKLLQDKLRALGIKATVINGGVCGSNPKSELVLYEHLLKPYAPDLVLLEANESDVEDYYVALHQGKMTFDEYGQAMSHLLRMWNDATSEGDSAVFAQKVATVRDMIARLDAFRSELAAQQQQFMVVSLSLHGQLYGPNGFLDSMLTASDLPVIDLKKCYTGNKPVRLGAFLKYYWRHDGHHTPAGYDLMAKSVLKELIERKYVGIP